MKKPITFKSAIFIVLGLHVAGVLAMFGWGSYNGKVAREEREKKRQMLSQKDTSKEWPDSDKRLRMVSTPPPKPMPSPPPKPSFASVIQNTNSSSLNRAVSELTNNISKQGTAAFNNISKNVSKGLKNTRPTIPLPSIKPFKQKSNNIVFKTKPIKDDNSIIVDAQFLQDKLNKVIIPVY